MQLAQSVSAVAHSKLLYNAHRCMPLFCSLTVSGAPLSLVALACCLRYPVLTIWMLVMFQVYQISLHER